MHRRGCETDLSTLELDGIFKRFAGVTALDGASLRLRPGTVHALLGENGAGKTTLMRIAHGELTRDGGQLLLDGAPVWLRSPRDAVRLRIGMVHQHHALVDALTVAENVELGARGLFRRAAVESRIRILSRESGLDVDPAARVRDLGIVERQRVEIIKALARDVRVLILDEPTAVLPPSEASALLDWVRRFATGDRSAVIITHRLREALAIADELTVLRLGRTVLSAPAHTVSERDVAAAMLGQVPKSSDTDAPMPAQREVRLVAQAHALTLRDAAGAVRLRDASFELHSGEIVGVAGVEGSGRHQLMRALAGRLAPFSGTLTLPPRIGFIPEDRHRDALALDLTLVENVALREAARRRGLFRREEHERQTARLLSEFRIRAAGPGERAAALSGGNQQRLVLARELSPLPELLVAEHPTRGLDVRAAAAIHERMRAAAASGAAVVMSSNDLEELVQLSHRVLVLHGGRLEEVPPDLSRIGARMVGAV